MDQYLQIKIKNKIKKYWGKLHQKHHAKFSECLRQIDSDEVRVAITKDYGRFDIICKEYDVYELSILKVIPWLCDEEGGYALLAMNCRALLPEITRYDEKKQKKYCSHDTSTLLVGSGLDQEPMRRYVEDLIERYEYQHK